RPRSAATRPPTSSSTRARAARRLRSDARCSPLRRCARSPQRSEAIARASGTSSSTWQAATRASFRGRLLAMIGTKVTLRVRMGSHDAHYAGELVDGARMLALFGDVATELLVRL